MAETKFIRGRKDRNYTVMDNTFLKDVRLSWKAKGVMAYLLSLPDDWQIYLSEIETHSPDGKSSLASAINELKEYGYLKAEWEKEKGKFKSLVYTVIENPYTEKPQTENPLTVNPITEKPFTENQTLLNTNIQNTKDIPITDNINIYGQAKKAESKKKFQKPSLEELKAYIQEHEYSVDAERFFDYYESNGWKVGKNSMKDWKACVRTWQKNEGRFNASAPKKHVNALYELDHPEDVGDVLF